MKDFVFKVITNIKSCKKNIEFTIKYFNKKVATKKQGNQIIYDAIILGKPCLIARGGAAELNAVKGYLNKKYSNKVRTRICKNAGVFPNNDEFLNRFCEYYMSCLLKADILSVWCVGAERKLVDRLDNSCKLIRLESLEPYYFDLPWSKALENKKVLIVSSFCKSIKSQYEKRELLFKNKDVLPKFKSICFVDAVVSNADNKTEYNDWFEALNSMQQKIKEQDFDVAIIGAGAYSLPLAYFVKSIGKIAVQMSGAIQILFGIKGKRWDTRKRFVKMYNENWIRPSKEEVPQNADIVEGGCYW